MLKLIEIGNDILWIMWILLYIHIIKKILYLTVEIEVDKTNLWNINALR